MIKRKLVKELFKAFYIQRWNDKIRPVELIEMDKHAHKMIITYCIGKYEEKEGNYVDWDEIIKGGIYELFRRIVISDIKSPIFYKIKQENKETFQKLNSWVFDQLESLIEDEDIKNDFREYLINDKYLSAHSQRILEAAHKYASFWEFKIIKHANLEGFQTEIIERDLYRSIGKFLDFEAMRQIMSREPIAYFTELCAQLRFQTRWAQMPRVPKTSVLGHSMMVAMLSYFFAKENGSCPKRLFNNFYCGLFHDLPEAVTRDIISPVKKSSKDFMDLIKRIEKDLAEKEIYPLIEADWLDEIKYFTEDEFSNRVIIDGKMKKEISVDEINEKYNNDAFNPIDGEIVKAADHLSAFMEAWHSSEFGIKSRDFELAMSSLKTEYIGKKIGKIEIGKIYEEF
jgi:putative hydrolase of HD superfamily